MKNLFVCLALVCLFAGCSGGGVEVKGKVTMDDGSAIPRGVVLLNGTTGSYQGMIQADGTYTIAGVANGDYKVAITGAMDSAPSDAAADMDYDKDGNFVESTAAEPKSLIKDTYGDPEKSGLTLKVPGSYDLKVEKVDGGGAPAGGAADGATDGGAADASS